MARLTRRNNWRVSVVGQPFHSRDETSRNVELIQCGAASISAFINSSRSKRSTPGATCGPPIPSIGPSELKGKLQTNLSPNRVRDGGDAVIIEMRPIRRLTHVLQNFLELLPSDWKIHFLHADDNHAWVRNAPALSTYLSSGHLELTPLRTFAPEHYPMAMAARYVSKGQIISRDRVRHLAAVHWYDNLLMSPDFWKAFKSPLVLLFQADSALCPSPSWTIDDFGDNFVFSGAPWPRNSLWFCRDSHEYRCVGNSGLSLWRRGVVLALLNNSHFTSGWGASDHMDVFLARRIQDKAWSDVLGGFEAVPSDHEAARFAIESWYPGMHANASISSSLLSYTPIGVHQPHSFHVAEHLLEISRRCPAAGDLGNLSTF